MVNNKIKRNEQQAIEHIQQNKDINEINTT